MLVCTNEHGMHTPRSRHVHQMFNPWVELHSYLYIRYRVVNRSIMGTKQVNRVLKRTRNERDHSRPSLRCKILGTSGMPSIASISCVLLH